MDFRFSVLGVNIITSSLVLNNLNRIFGRFSIGMNLVFCVEAIFLNSKLSCPFHSKDVFGLSVYLLISFLISFNNSSWINKCEEFWSACCVQAAL